MEWTKLHCREGEDWKIVVKITIIMRDLVIGNEKLKGKGYLEEAVKRVTGKEYEGKPEIWKEYEEALEENKFKKHT